MYRLLFTNWKIAALWVIGTMASLGAVFSGGSDSKMNRLLNEVSTPPPQGVATEAPTIIEEEVEDPSITADSPSTATIEEEEGVTYITLPDGRKAVLQQAPQPGQDGAPDEQPAAE